MSFEEHFYWEELDYLRQLGNLMARENPHLAHFLAENGADPDVERLLEAFAFLSGNLRQKLEDEFPEFTHGIIHMRWANYLRPVPSMTVIEYRPDFARLSVPVKVCRNELISSGKPLEASSGRKVSKDESEIPLPSCHFTLARDVWLLPLCIRDIRNSSSLEEGVIEIDFFTKAQASPRSLDLNKLTFWLSDEDHYTRYQLYLWFSERLVDAELVAEDRTLPLPDMWLDAAGFEQEDGLLPWPQSVHNGYRSLQEFFCYPESFFFFHLRGTIPLPDDFPVNAFTLRLHFNQPLPANIRIHQGSLRPYCTPAVNLFAQQAEPIKPDKSKTQYPLRASHRSQDMYDIFQVTSVSSRVSVDDGVPEQPQRMRVWPEFEGSRRQVEYKQQREAVYWHHRTKTSLLHRGFEHSIAFVHADSSLPENSPLNDETVIASLICTNRRLPVKLNIGDICIAVSKNPALASFSNITQPTAPLDPVTDGKMYWSLISCMNQNYLTLLDRDALIQVLRTFDLPGHQNPLQARLPQQKLDAIEKLDTHPIDRLFKGVPVRGLCTTLWINPAPFVCEGEIYLLGLALSQFFALYASISSFHCLKIINTESQETWEWQHAGQHALM